jgi:hypothetical protein
MRLGLWGLSNRFTSDKYRSEWPFSWRQSDIAAGPTITPVCNPPRT